MRKILIVEDDLKLNNGIRLALKGQEYICFQSESVSSAIETFQREKVDLILLDINLPDGSGMDWLMEIRKRSTIPVILISANNMEMDIVTGLELGANDYITKPFSLMVLRARIGVQLREIESESTDIVQMGDFYFDFRKMEFLVGANTIDLSRTEQKLLRKLVDNPGITLSRSTLTDEIWSGDSEYVDEHALTVVIKRLRDKLEDSPGKGPYIKTVYGIGYAWDNGNGSNQT